MASHSAPMKPEVVRGRLSIMVKARPSGCGRAMRRYRLKARGGQHSEYGITGTNVYFGDDDFHAVFEERMHPERPPGVGRMSQALSCDQGQLHFMT